jgi:ComF family protein
VNNRLFLMHSLRGLVSRLRVPQTCLLCGAMAAAPDGTTEADTSPDARGGAGRLHTPAADLTPRRVSTCLCAACAADLPWHTRDACPCCAAPSPAAAVCGACLARPPAFDASVAALAYRFPLDSLIPRFKYHGQLTIAPVLADSLIARLRDTAGHALPDRVVAMPMHPARLAERGLHHANDLARRVARGLSLRLDEHSCRRVRDTPPQVTLKFDARRKNVRGAFACSTPLHGERVALVDDVMTTGTSLDALAATLKQAGAVHVSCWVVARALAKTHD